MNDRIGALVDKETKLKASFVLKSRGSDLSTEVRKMLEKLAEEYDKTKE